MTKRQNKLENQLLEALTTYYNLEQQHKHLLKIASNVKARLIHKEIVRILRFELQPIADELRALESK